MSVINPVISQVIRPVTQPPTKPPKGGGGGNPALTRDLEAWWDMSGASDANETDSLGTYTLEKAGVGTLSSSTSVFRTSKRARVTSNASSNYLRESSGAAPDVLQPTGDFTFFIWARPSDTVTRNLCGAWSETGDQRAWRILHNSTGWRFEISTDGTSGTVTGVQSSTGGALTWAFICVTRKGNTVSLYVNGDSAVTASVSGAMHTSTAQFQIGQVQQSADAGFYGSTQNSIFDTAAMWSRALRGRDINERATSLYANGAGYAYADIGNVSGYASLTAAEASGDKWTDGEIVRCVNGNVVEDFVHKSALSAVAGAGLIHRYPYNDSSTISSIDSAYGFAASTDPGTWGWTDNSTGAEDTDYAFDTNAGRTRIRDLTTGGKASIASPQTTTTAVKEMFGVMRASDVSETVTSPAQVILWPLFNVANDAGTNRAFSYLYFRGTDTTWHVREAGATFSPLSGYTKGTERDFYIYLKYDTVSIWEGADHVGTWTPPNNTFSAQPLATIEVGDAAASGTADFTFGDFLYGIMTTA